MSARPSVNVRAIGPNGKPLRVWAKQFDRDFTRKVVVPSIIDALNRTVARSKTRAVRRIAKASQLPAKAVRRRTRVLKANRRRMDAGASLIERPVAPATALKVRQTRKGVSAGKHRFPGSFLGTDTGGRLQVFHRTGATRYPLESDKVEIVNAPDVWDTLFSRYARTFTPRRLAQQLDYRARRAGLVK